MKSYMGVYFSMVSYMGVYFSLQKYSADGWNILGTASSPKASADKIVNLKNASIDKNSIILFG